MIHGNMSAGVVKSDLMVGTGPENYQEALSEPGVRKMDFTGKLLKGFVYVEENVPEPDKVLQDWINRGRNFALSLPAK